MSELVSALALHKPLNERRLNRLGRQLRKGNHHCVLKNRMLCDLANQVYDPADGFVHR